MDIKNILRNHWKKATPERVELFEWMGKNHLFNSADIEKNFSHIGRASIFRTLKLFCDIWVLRRIYLWDSWDKYEVECCETHHHEHMKCKQCWDILNFAADNICKKIFSEAKKLSFHIEEHSLSIFGKCKKCTL